MRLSDLRTDIERDAVRNRPMSEGSTALLSRRWVRRIRIAEDTAKPHLFYA